MVTDASFTLLNSHDTGEFITWYVENRETLVERLVNVQIEGEYRRNINIFDDYFTTDNTIRETAKKQNVSDKYARKLINRQLKILLLTYEREKYGSTKAN